MDILFRGGTIVTCDAEDRVVPGDLRVRDGSVAEIGPDLATDGAGIVDVAGRWLLPGFVQTHVHTVQTLFRGLADDLPLLDWLRKRIWPLERALDPDATYWSARLGLTELLLGGTTAILDMATVHHTDSVFRAARECGIRATVGKALMDRPGEDGLGEPTDEGIASAVALCEQWHGVGRLRYAFSPRFVPSCTEALLRATVGHARSRGCLLHTHASENAGEVDLVRSTTGMDNVAWLDHVGFTGRDVVLAHCIHLTGGEEVTLARTGTSVAHCPGSNLKLGSGLARIPELLERGVRCTLGADGAPCNNRLDMFAEMRLAALIQAPRTGPGRLPAARVLRMATRDGAEALGLPTGSIESGRPADIVVVDPAEMGVIADVDPRSALVYALGPAAVEHVWIEGEEVVRAGRVLAWDTAETMAGAAAALARVRERAGL